MENRSIQAVVLILILGVGALGVKRAVDAQRPQGDDREQIQQMLLSGEIAAEQMRPAGINRLLSEDYRDSLGMSDSSLKYQIADYLRRQRSVEVEIPTDSIRIEIQPGGKQAAVSFHVSLTTRGEAGNGRADSEMTLTLAKEPVHYYWIFPGEEWRVTAAEGYASLE